MIWLPPSEGKTAPTSGPRLDPSALSLPSLDPARRCVMEALGRLGAGREAAEVLGLGPRSAGEAGANTVLETAPCARAVDLFSGVLFAAAGLDSLEGDARERARALVLVFSGLFGAVRLDDLLPDHRLPMGTTLPGIGGLAAFWRPPLRRALEPEGPGAVVLDLRSGPYRAACPAPWAHVIRLGAAREIAGRRRIISHDAKTWRGLVCGALVRSSLDASDEGATLSVVEEVARAARTVDARGREHRVTSVEIGEATPTHEGGSVRDVVLVTD